MRKILFFMLLLVQLTAATAFAYTNKEDGFKTQSPSSANYVEAVGKHFYGFIDDNGAAAGYTECLSSEQASKFLGAPFSTAAFDKTYSDILLLQRNGISNERINQLVAEPVVSPLFAFAENEEPDYLVSAQKFGSNKYIAVTFNVNPETEPVTIYYTSANDKLYMLMAEQQTAVSNAVKNHPENTIGVIGGADGPTDIYVKDNVLAKETNKTFLKKFKTVKPVDKNTAFTFGEKTANVKVTLPDEWFYVQLADNRYNEEAVGVTVAMPQEAMVLILKEALDIGVTDIESAVIASQAAAADKSISAELTDKKDDIMDIFRHGIIILSVKATDKSFSKFVFDNPNKTAYGVNEALEDIKAALMEQGTEFKTFAYNTDFKDGQGSFSLQTELKPAETDFYYTLVAEGKVIGKGAYLAFVFDRNGDDENTALKFWNGKTLLKD